MSDLEKKFIKRVRQEIATCELTLTSVAEMIGSSRQVLSQILNCKFNSMRADTMLRLAKLLEISLDEIIFPERDGETEQCNTYSLGKIEIPKGAMKQIIADGEREKEAPDD